MSQTETTDILDLFCTPPLIPETDNDQKVLADAELLDIPFEGQTLKGYAWGEGRPVLLAHGWGSRASHLASLGRILAKAGFRVLAYDQPAHGQSLKQGQANRSSLPEFCRAIATVAGEPLYALVGHSLGAAASALVAGGSPVVPSARVSAERLVLISSPSNVISIISQFCRMTGLHHRRDELNREIEAGYGFALDAYAVDAALSNCSARVLIVHDPDDGEIPFSDALTLRKACPSARFAEIKGAGHREILGNRMMLKAVREFLIEL